jgi:hypothetical protein
MTEYMNGQDSFCKVVKDYLESIYCQKKKKKEGLEETTKIKANKVDRDLTLEQKTQKCREICICSCSQ